MTGPDHYRRAEELIEIYDGSSVQWVKEWGAETLQRAQIHATLALAAATAYPAIVEYDGGESGEAGKWAGVTS